MAKKVEIVYCAVWHYTDRAISVMADLVKKYEYQISEITLVPSDGGKFEISVDGKLVYSKLQTGRHSNPGEVEKLVGEVI